MSKIKRSCSSDLENNPPKDSRVNHIKNLRCRDLITDLNINETKLNLASENLHVSRLTPAMFTAILNSGQHLKYLQFESVSDDFCDAFPLEPDNYFKDHNLIVKLIELKILICPHNIKESVLSILLAHCPSLETLVICFAPEGHANRGITGKCFQYLGNNIKHLIFGNLNINQTTIHNLLNSNGRSVQEIEILFPIVDQTFARVFELTNLRKLTFKACKTDFMQIRNLSKLTNLESLQVERLDFCNDTLEDLFTPVFENCNKLKEFKVSGVFKWYSNELLEIIAKNNLKLTHLHIYPNMFKKRLNPINKIEISKSIGALTSMVNIQSLALPYSDLDDQHLQSLLLNCPSLTTIDLSYCKKITSTECIISAAEKNPDRNYQMYLFETKIQSIPVLPGNLKLCICDLRQFDLLPLIIQSFYDLI
uniref:F-box domain-containing protein n=1 Tax=Tetranychus urticae TaxID=32264 RepID=T1K9L9_TETUR